MTMMKRIFGFSALTLLLLSAASCRMSSVEWVDFSDLDVDKSFIPFYTTMGDFDSKAMASCSVPGGETVGEVIETETKTTSTTGAGLFTSLISMWRSAQIVSYCGSYMSTDIDGKPIRLSGRIVLPADGKVSRIMVAAHFTIAADREAPSNSVTMESMFAARGIAVIEPDYIGYGVTADRIHPYLCSDVTGRNVVDMYFAALPFLKKIGRMPQYDDIYILGYSQGGAVAVTTAKEFEFRHPEVKIRLTMCGGGPYDICTTYDTLVDNDYTDIPCGVPLIIQGMNEGARLNLDYSKFFVPHVADNMDEWLNSKKYTVSQVTEMIGSHHISDMLTPAARDKAKDLMTDLYRAMVDNSVINEWIPLSPMYMFHSIDDNVVPYINCVQMQDKMIGYNVTFNCGHYGNHQAGCLRFMFSCLDLLKEHGDIDWSI